MRDYRYTGRGVPVFVAQMTDEEIHSCLNHEIQIDASDGEADPIRCVLKRLKLEQEIRALGLRK